MRGRKLLSPSDRPLASRRYVGSTRVIGWLLAVWLVGVGAALMTPARASGGTVRAAAAVRMGPVLAGSSAVWVETGPGGDWYSIAVADPAGPRRVVAAFGEDPARCQFIEDLTASADRLAFVRRIATRGQHGCYTEATELYLGELDAAPNLLARSDGATRCSPVFPSLDGQRLALAQSNCPGEDIVVREAASGALVEAIALGEGQRPISPPGIELAGGFVAWASRTSAPDAAHEWVIVYDRAARRELYRADLLPLISAQWEPPVNHTFTFALDADGTVAALYPRYTGFGQPEMRVAYMTPQEPWPRDLGVSAGPMDATQPLGPRLSVNRRRIAVARAAERDYAVVDLTGKPIDVFGCDGYGSVDFDGERLAWADSGLEIRNEPFPADTNCPHGPQPSLQPGSDATPRAQPLADGAALLLSPQLVANRRGLVRARIACRRTRRCTGRVRLGHRSIGRLAQRRIALPPRARRLVLLRLNAAARRLLSSRRVMRVTVQLRLDGRPTPTSTTARATLRAAATG